MKTLEEAVDALEDDVHTIIIPFFNATPREKFIKGVIRCVKQELKAPDPSRVYLFFQEGVTKKKTTMIWDTICARAKIALTDEEQKSEQCKVYSFGNVPTRLIMVFLDHAAVRKEVV